MPGFKNKTEQALDIDKQIAKKKSFLDGIQAQIDAQNATIEKSGVLEKKIAELEETLLSISNEIEKAKTQKEDILNNYLVEKIKAKEEESIGLDKEINDKRSILNRFEPEIAKRELLIKNKDLSLADIENKIDKIQGEFDNVSMELYQKKQELSGMERLINDKRSELRATEEELSILVDRKILALEEKKTLSSELSALSVKIDETRSDLSDKIAEKEVFAKEITDKRKVFEETIGKREEEITSREKAVLARESSLSVWDASVSKKLEALEKIKTKIIMVNPTLANKLKEI